MTLGDIAQQAFIKNRQIAPGEPVPAELGVLALNDANLILEEWNITSVMIWTENILQFPLLARTLPVYWYTIGPSGADFTAPRPTRIDRANIVLTNSNPTIRIPLQIVNDLQWSDVTTPDLGSAPYPTKLYNNGDFPNSRLYLWPFPNQNGNALELFVPNAVSQFADLSDTFSFPPGFQNAFMLTLAERMIQSFDDAPPSLVRMAARARAAFARINTVAPKCSTTDSGMPNSGGDGQGNNSYNGWSGR